jgi:hypothetical protein
MNSKFIMGARRALAIFALTLFCVAAASAQQGTGSVRGRVTDELGGAIVNTPVTLTDAGGATKTTTTNENGVYTFGGLAPGRYTINVTSQGFAPYQNAAVDVTGGGTTTLDIVLQVTLEQQQVTVSADTNTVSTDPTNNVGAIVLKPEDLQALPDDPDDLQAALQALAGPSAGPNGGQIYIDGFTGGRFPPKESIREVRINSNPFSAEYDRLGFGRIEIFTKPGSDVFHGTGFFTFNDESLNSRNPFAPNRAAFQRRQFGGNVSGPIIKKKASFFFDVERREIDDNAIVLAQILDPSFNVITFNQVVATPSRRTTVSPRIDYQLNDKNTIVGRYTFTQFSNFGGVGGFTLPSRETSSTSNEHTVQLTETAILNAKTVNETRFQYVHRRTNQTPLGAVGTAIDVEGAFNGGGAPFNLAFNSEDRYEIQNYTTLALGNHSVKFGGRLRHVNLSDFSPSNFSGTFVFTGGTFNGIQYTPLQQYAAVLQGVSGVFPSQFTINAGNPQVAVSQTDFGGYVQDDWRYRPNLTLSAGLRYETQTNIHDKTDFAPRLSFAWAPGAGANGQGKTVLRGGVGLFYDRFSESLVEQAARFNGVNEQQYIIQNPNFFSTIPPLSQLQSAQVPQTVYRIAPDLRTPYVMQAAFGVERQLPHNTTVGVNYIGSRTLHLLRSRNINAPLPGTIVRDPTTGRITSAQYPFGATAGNIFEYESSGRFNQNQMIVTVRSTINKNISFTANYVLAKANSDTDGAGTFPANQYDLSGEYGRAAIDVRHRFFLFGNFSLPYGFRLSPFVIASTGRPFNIVLGRDINGDTLFTERPTFAQLSAACARAGITGAQFCTAAANVSDPNAVIPRNFGEGPGSFSFNLRFGKTFGFGHEREGAASGGRGGGGGGGGRGGRGIGGPFGFPGGGGFGGDASSNKRYNLSLSIFARNLFNNVNLSPPVGNLNSPFFGRSLSIAGGFGENTGAGNRTIEAQVRFSF